MELGEFSSVVESIYGAAAEPDGWQRLVPTLARLFRSGQVLAHMPYVFVR